MNKNKNKNHTKKKKCIEKRKKGGYVRIEIKNLILMFQ